MKVVLLKDVESVGRKGEIAEVADGHGTNYLIPKGLATIATDDAVLTAKAFTARKKEKKEEQSNFVESLAKKVNKKKFLMRVEASSGGRLYGSIGSKEIEKELGSIWKTEGKGVTLEVDLAQPVKETGKYPLDVVISSDGKKKKVEIVLSVVIE